ncbi:MAG: hypothetical protein EOO04_18510 [Chitinophagaceae bacterium]|nr:MAG: hypothetical protein EOO04_18510 [Chitinophagaceae bacterium]
MFCQWLLIISSLLFVSNPGNSAGKANCSQVEEVCEAPRIVQADTQYGWQVSGSSVAAFDVPAN